MIFSRSSSARAVVVAFLTACSRGDSRSSAPTRSDVVPRARAGEHAGGPVFEERIGDRATLAQLLAEEGIADGAVLAAMRKVPRHAFVAAEYRSMAYDNRPLPIAGGQTISQPYRSEERRVGKECRSRWAA